MESIYGHAINGSVDGASFIIRLVRVAKGLPESDYEHKGVEQV
ncbi:hypothetical protein LR68_03606 [Anoxybacillus sp. BCO1]|nr:hypothetical protein LR68_03606 [Anoxybacillus sp. BCO1]